MLSFNSTGIGSITPLGLYAGYLMADQGNVWVGAAFLVVTLFALLLCVCSLSRFIINYRRARLSKVV